MVAVSVYVMKPSTVDRYPELLGSPANPHTEPTDVGPESYAETVITCLQGNVANSQTVKFTIGSVAYLATVNTGTASSTSSVIGTNSAGDNDALAARLKTSLDAAFVKQITSGEVVISIADNLVTLKAQNKFYITAAQPTFAGSGVSASTFTFSDWTGSDLLKITGALLKRSTIQKGVTENDPEDIDTVKFASIQAKDRDGVTRTDADDQIFSLGSDIESDSNYYSKVFFGMGSGPSKSPRHRIIEPPNLVVDSATTAYEAVKHTNGAASTIGGSFAAHFSVSGVGNSGTVASAGSLGFNTSDALLDFAGSGTRRLDLNVDIKAGETVYIRWAAATFDSGASGGWPTATTSYGSAAENADSGDDGVKVKVSVDGGASYSSVTSVYSVTVAEGSGDFTAVSSPDLITPNSTHLSTNNFQVGAAENNSGIVPGANKYPIMKFTATTTTKLRLEQPNWSSLSSAYDHVIFRYLVITTVGAGSDIVPVSSRGNFTQNAVATDVELRGAKYGLASPVKLNTSAIFRAGSFGHVRDMLEQRLLTRTFDGVRPTEPPVAVSFQKRKTKKVTSPEETNSANLDVFCTSSLPYFDGIVRDRASTQPDLLDEVDIDITV